MHRQHRAAIGKDDDDNIDDDAQQWTNMTWSAPPSVHAETWEDVPLDQMELHPTFIMDNAARILREQQQQQQQQQQQPARYTRTQQNLAVARELVGEQRMDNMDDFTSHPFSTFEDVASDIRSKVISDITPPAASVTWPASSIAALQSSHESTQLATHATHTINLLRRHRISPMYLLLNIPLLSFPSSDFVIRFLEEGAHDVVAVRRRLCRHIVDLCGIAQRDAFIDANRQLSLQQLQYNYGFNLVFLTSHDYIIYNTGFASPRVLTQPSQPAAAFYFMLACDNARVQNTWMGGEVSVDYPQICSPYVTETAARWIERQPQRREDVRVTDALVSAMARLYRHGVSGGPCTGHPDAAHDVVLCARIIVFLTFFPDINSKAVNTDFSSPTHVWGFDGTGASRTITRSSWNSFISWMKEALHEYEEVRALSSVLSQLKRNQRRASDIDNQQLLVRAAEDRVSALRDALDTLHINPPNVARTKKNVSGVNLEQLSQRLAEIIAPYHSSLNRHRHELVTDGSLPPWMRTFGAMPFDNNTKIRLLQERERWICATTPSPRIFRGCCVMPFSGHVVRIDSVGLATQVQTMYMLLTRVPNYYTPLLVPTNGLLVSDDVPSYAGDSDEGLRDANGMAVRTLSLLGSAQYAKNRYVAFLMYQFQCVVLNVSTPWNLITQPYKDLHTMPFYRATLARTADDVTLFRVYQRYIQNMRAAPQSVMDASRTLESFERYDPQLYIDAVGAFIFQLSALLPTIRTRYTYTNGRVHLPPFPYLIPWGITSVYSPGSEDTTFFTPWCERRCVALMESCIRVRTSTQTNTIGTVACCVMTCLCLLSELATNISQRFLWVCDPMMWYNMLRCVCEVDSSLVLSMGTIVHGGDAMFPESQIMTRIDKTLYQQQERHKPFSIPNIRTVIAPIMEDYANALGECRTLFADDPNRYYTYFNSACTALSGLAAIISCTLVRDRVITPVVIPYVEEEDVSGGHPFTFTDAAATLHTETFTPSPNTRTWHVGDEYSHVDEYLSRWCKLSKNYHLSDMSHKDTHDASRKIDLNLSPYHLFDKVWSGTMTSFRGVTREHLWTALVAASGDNMNAKSVDMWQLAVYHSLFNLHQLRSTHGDD